MVKCTGRGLVVKRPGVLSKVQMLTLVLGVGVFSLLPTSRLYHDAFANLPPLAGWKSHIEHPFASRCTSHLYQSGSGVVGTLQIKHIVGGRSSSGVFRLVLLLVPVIGCHKEPHTNWQCDLIHPTIIHPVALRKKPNKSTKACEIGFRYSCSTKNAPRSIQ